MEAHEPTRRRLKSTMQPNITSNDFGSFWNELADSNSIFVVAEMLLMMRGRVTEREFLEPLKMVRSYIVGRRCVCPSSHTVVRSHTS